MLSDYLTLALKNVRKRGVRSWLTMLGIFLGIAAVVSLISLGQGLQTAISGQFGASVNTDILTVSSAETGFGPPGATAVRKLNDNDLELVESVAGVREAVSRLIRIVNVDFNDVKRFHFIGSIPEDQDEIDLIVDNFNVKVAQGRFLKPEDTGKIVIGDDFVSEDLFGKDIRVGTNLEIEGKEFEVVGILERASTFTLNSVIMMNEEEMKNILDIGNEIDLIVVKVESEDLMETVAENIERKFRKDRNQDPGEEDFAVQTPVQSLSTVNAVLTVVNIVVAGIAAIALLIGGIGIANTMFTSVLERTKEIGVMKAIGAKNRDILAVFITEAGLLGLVGGIVGALIGLSLAFLASSAANSALGENIFQVTLSLPLLIGSISFSFLIGILSGIVPAYQASKLHPVEALRK